ncbi:hypothetical protein T08_13190, partial [Trichinella sp. T8]
LGGVTSVIFRYSVQIFCHTKTCSSTVSPIHCKEKQNGNAQSANCLPVTKRGI